MRLRLSELQESDSEAQKIRKENLKGYKKVDKILHYQGLSFIPEVIWTEVITQHHNDLLAGHFGIDKTRELIGRKYYWPSLKKDVESYIKSCNICLALKAVQHKLYSDL